MARDVVVVAARGACVRADGRVHDAQHALHGASSALHCASLALVACGEDRRHLHSTDDVPGHDVARRQVSHHDALLHDVPQAQSRILRRMQTLRQGIS